jgi:hypothetical protein
MYEKIPFRLMNVSETFWRAMDIAIGDEKEKSIVYIWMT